MATLITVNNTSPAEPQTVRWLVECSPGVSKGIKRCPAKLYRRVYVGWWDNEFPQDITNQYVAIFGKPRAHRRYFVRISSLNAQGKRSSQLEGFVDVA